MMKFFQRTKGAVSIFLIMILVPMLTVASILIDSSRLKLAQSSMSAAGDLALNTALSQYNNILKDMYGLFATSQSNAELLANLSEYYEQSIVASGVPIADAKDYVGQIMGMLGSQSGQNSDDILNMALGKFDVKAPKGANLANPVMLKKQIIEFMKYRAPLDLGVELLDAIKVFKTVSEQVKVIEKQQKFYEEQKNVFTYCENAWKHFYKYAMTDFAPTEFYYNRMIWDFNGKEEVEAEYKAALDFGEDEDENYESYFDILNRATKNIVLYFQDYVAGNSTKTDYDFYEPCVQGYGESGNQALRIKTKTGTATSWSEVKGGNTGSVTLETLRSKITKVEQAMAAVKKAKEGEMSQYNKYKLVDAGTYSFRAAIEAVEQWNREANDSSKKTGYIQSCLALKKAYDELESAKKASKNKPNPPKKSSYSPMSKTYASDPGPAPSPPSPPGDDADEDEWDAYDEAYEDYEDEYDDWKEDYDAYVKYQNYLRYENDCETYATVTLPEWVKNYDDDPKSSSMNGTTFSYVTATITKDTDSEKYTITHNGSLKVTSQKTTTLNNAKPLIEEFSKLSLKVKKAWEQKKGPSGEFEQLKKKTNEELEFVKKDSKDHYHNNIDRKIQNLKDAKGYLQSIQSLLNGAFKTKLEAWDDAASNPKLKDDETTQSQKEEIENIKKIFKPEDVAKLIGRLDKVIASLEKTKQELDKFCIGKGKKKLWLIPVTYQGYADNLNLDGFDKKYPPVMKGGKEDESHKIIFEQNYYYGSVRWDTLELDSKITNTWPEESNPNPSVSLGTTRFYQYLYQNFDTGEEPSGSDIKNEGEEELDEKKDEAEDEADEAKDEVDGDNAKQSSNNISDKANRPSQEWGGVKAELIASMNASTDADQDLAGVTNGTNSIFSTLFNALGKGLVKVRDCLYLDNYILRMFTYDTFEAETVYNDTEKGMPIADKFFNGTTENGKYSAQIAKAVSMTNTPMNPTNNYAYGSEVEYILWGGSNTGNVVKTYATIFGIRLALNIIYAFTDSEIREGALAVATAMFGVPPLTVLIPAAKVAIIIAIAIAESAYDIYKLKKGEPVPIYKSTDTWVMKISHIFSELGGEMINEAIDKGYALLSDWLAKTSDELADAINSGSEELATALNDAIEDKFDKYAFSALDALADACNTANQLEKVGDLVNLEEKVDAVEEMLHDWLKKQNMDTSVASDVAAMVKEAAVDKIISNGYITQMLDAINETAQGNINAMKDKLESFRSDLQSTVTNYINKGGSMINEAKNKVMGEIQNAAAQGVDKLKDTITSNIDISYGSGTSKSTQRGSAAIFASLISWQYSDYLTLFLLIATLTNEEAVLLKTADVIQANMQHLKVKGAGGEFLMSKANTYLTIEAEVQVKPFMLALGMVQETMKNQLTGVNWYTVDYTATKGY